MTDIELLTDALRSRFPAPPPVTGEGRSGNLVLCVLDCVLSLNRNYDKVVLLRVKAFARKRPEVHRDGTSTNHVVGSHSR
jgi:hypothetical protein